MKIEPAKHFSNLKSSALHVQPVVKEGYSSFSTLAGKKTPLLRKMTTALTWPIRLLFRLIKTVVYDYLLFWIPCAKHRRVLNWQETKKAFTGIYTAIVTSTATETDRIKKFNEAKSKLSSGALERFRTHIAFVLAEEEGCTELIEKEKFQKEKCTEEQLNGYLRSLNNQVLKQAVISFQKELDEKTK